MNRRFKVINHGPPGKLGLSGLLQRFADEQWVTDDMDAQEAAQSVLEAFARQVHAELQLLEVATKTLPSD